MNEETVNKKLELSQLDWVAVVLMGLAVVIAPIWAGGFATPPFQSLKKPDDINQLFQLLGTSLIGLLIGMAYCVQVWREWQRPVAIGMVRYVAGAFALLGGWATITAFSGQAAFMSMNTLAVLFGCIFLGVMVSRLGRDPKAVLVFSGVIVAAGAIAAGFGIQEYLLYLKIGIPYHATTGSFLNPNFLAGYLLLTIPVTLGLFSVVPERVFRLAIGIALVLQGCCLLLTGSRTGTAIGLLAILIWVILLVLGKVEKTHWKLTGIALGVVFVGIILGNAPFLSRFIGKTPSANIVNQVQKTTSEQSYSGEFRKYTWMGSIKMATENPVFGTGIGTFTVAYLRYGETAFTGHAHNSYFQFAGETGFIGILLLMTGLAAVSAFVVYVFLLKKPEPFNKEMILLAALLASFVATLLHSFVDSDWYVVATITTLSVILGLMIAIARGMAPLSVQTPQTLGKNIVSAGLLLITFVFWRSHATFWNRMNLTNVAPPNPLESCKNAASADPFDPEAHLIFAQVLEATNKPQEALQEIQKAVQLAQSGRNFYLLGRYLGRQNQWQQAVSAFQQAVNLEPRNLQTLKGFAEAQVQAGQLAEAKTTYQTMVTLENLPLGRIRATPEYVETDFAYAHIGLAEIARKENNLTETKNQFLAAQKILKNYWEHKDIEQNAAQRSEEKKKALEELFKRVNAEVEGS